ncbi:hypothetical protein GCM10007863_08760 [Dyella mobilis]|nr:hypothetical protein GCM10007863_08760 [Dyella mobilis]
MVPPFDQMFGRNDWGHRLDEWLQVLGYERVWLDGHQLDKLPEFYIAIGHSVRGVLHAVIYSNGALVHDPHFSDTGITEVKDTYHLEPIGKES